VILDILQWVNMYQEMVGQNKLTKNIKLFFKSLFLQGFFLAFFGDLP